jgi:phage-related protein
MWTVEIDDSAVREFAELPAGMREEMLRVFEMLERQGPQFLPPRLVSKIGGRLWELRIKTGGGISRAFYFTVENTAIVVTVYVKKTQKIPGRVMERAVKRMQARSKLEDLKRRERKGTVK